MMVLVRLHVANVADQGVVFEVVTSYVVEKSKVPGFPSDRGVVDGLPILYRHLLPCYHPYQRRLQTIDIANTCYFIILFIVYSTTILTS